MGGGLGIDVVLRELQGCVGNCESYCMCVCVCNEREREREYLSDVGRFPIRI